MDIKPNLTAAVATNVKQPVVSSINYKVKIEIEPQNADTMGSDEEIIIKQEFTELDITKTLIKREHNYFLDINRELSNIKYEANNAMLIENVQESYTSEEKIPGQTVAEDTTHTGGPIVRNCNSTSEPNPILHLTAHTEEKLFSCRLCKCTKKSDLLEHKKIHNGEKVCDCKASKKPNRTLLIRKCIEEKPFKCQRCDFKCSQVGRLRRHELRHIAPKRFSCELCDYECYMRSALYQHMRSHTGGKLFSCGICNFKCSVKSDLVGHEMTHSVEKPFKCTLCSYKTAWKGCLTCHLKTHVRVKPFRTKLLVESKVEIDDEPLTAFKLEVVDIKAEIFQ